MTTTKPNITVHDVSAYKISDEDNYNQCIFTFSCDKNIENFEVRADGSDRNSGTVVEKADILYCSDSLVCGDSLVCSDFNVESGVKITACIDHLELPSGDKDYLIKVFAKEKDGEWSE